MDVNIVDSVTLARQMLVAIESCDNPILFVDLEGIQLSRQGSISILQLYIPVLSCVYLVDVHTLSREAFTTTIDTGLSLKSLLESTKYIKVFFDVRNDSDALYAHFQVDLKCIVDLQLFEYATRPNRGRFVSGLAKCIEYDSMMGYADRMKWEKTKDAGRRLFTPELGGSYEVFNKRPLSLAIVDYCTQDVTVMPKLLITYAGRLRPNLASQVQSETRARIVLSQSTSYIGHGRHKAIGPDFSWYSVYKPLDYPISIVCSKALIELCNPRRPCAIAQDSIVHPVDPSRSPKEAVIVTEKDSSIVESVLVDALKSTSIFSPKDNKVSNSPENETTQKTDTLISAIPKTPTFSGPPKQEKLNNHEYEHEPELDDDPPDMFDLEEEFGPDQDYNACGSECGWCGHGDY